MLVNPRRRMVAFMGAGLLAVGAFAGVALLPNSRTAATSPAVPTAAARAAVRNATSVSEAFVAIADAVMPSVVRIQVERTADAQPTALTGTLQDLFGRPTRPSQQERVPEFGGGTGFIVSADGYILTNHHVIAGADRITVTLHDKRTLNASVVGSDPLTDVAVIRVSADNLVAAALGNSDDARVGEWVLAIGNPGFDNAAPLDFTVTGGIISAKGRPLNVLGAEASADDPDGALYAIEDFIQTDAVINPGNSGGPLVDLQGTVIGINTAIASTTGYSQGYGFAIPSKLAQRVMRDLIAHGFVRRPILGIVIRDVESEDAEVYRLPRIAGVVVEDIAPESPAQRSGLRPHDVIVAVDSTPISRLGDLQRIVALHQPDETVQLAVVRYGDSLNVNVRLMEAEATRSRPRAEPAPTAAGIGLEIEELTPIAARQLGFAQPGGALISRVIPGSAADRKDVTEGARIIAIDRDTVDSAAEARASLSAARSGQVVSMVIQFPDGRTYIANVRVP